MKIRRFAPVVRLACGVSLLATLPACSLLHRHHGATEAAAPAHPKKVAPRATARGLALELKASPDPLKLGETREISVNFVVRNVSSKAVTLKFPTTQIIEIVLRDVATGAIVSKWSTDRTFTPDGRIVSINQGERLEFTEPITTRDLKVGNVYNLEVWFIGYENELRAKKVIIPQP